MLQHVILLSVLSTAISLVPVEEQQYYKIYKLSEVDFEARQSEYHLNEGLRSVVEYPYSGTVPEDDGGNFGDITFPSSVVNKNGTLIARDTIINTDDSSNFLIIYGRTFNSTYVEDFNLLNFGRQRGWAYRATIHHNVGVVEGEILVAAGNIVRILAEVYARV